MSWMNLTGDVYDIPSKTNIDFNHNAVLLNFNGLSLVYLHEEEGKPVSPRDSIMSVPQYRFDEVQEVVEHGDKLYENISIELYRVDSYLTYPYKIDSIMYSDDAHLYDSKSDSFVFRRSNACSDNFFEDDSIKVKENKIIIEKLVNNDVCVVTEASLKEYISEENVYQLIPLNKKRRGIYNMTR